MQKFWTTSRTSSASAADGDGLRSFVASFRGPLEMSELAFEQAMWERLQALHDLDARTCEWDRRVSSDPASPTSASV